MEEELVKSTKYLILYIVAVQKIYKICSRTKNMVFTEVKERNQNKYYYRVCSFREEDKVKKKRNYLGKNLSKQDLILKEKLIDKEIYGFKRKRKEDFEKIKLKLVKILKEKGVKKAGIFGSYARGEQNKNSDIDILIELPKKLKGFRFFDLHEEISKELGKKVDIVTYGGINHLLKEKILLQEVRII